jgi:periplasmic divalent cation tolerance protein
MTDKIIVFNTCASAEEAERIARALVNARLAACVNVLGGARSYYRWQGAIEDAGEWLLVIKSSRAQFDRLRAELERLHSYTVPEIVAVPIVDGSLNYLNWLDQELKAATDETV